MIEKRLLQISGDLESGPSSNEVIGDLGPGDTARDAVSGLFANLDDRDDNPGFDFTDEEVARDEFDFTGDLGMIAPELSRQEIVELRESAELYWDNQEYEEAFEAYSLLLDNAPDNPAYIQNLGAIASQLGDNISARLFYEQYADLLGEHPEIADSTGIGLEATSISLHHLSGVIDASDESLSEVSVQRLVEHADRLVEHGNDRLALDVYLLLQGEFPGNVNYIQNVGAIYQRLGMVDEAVAAYDEYLYLLDNDSVLRDERESGDVSLEMTTSRRDLLVAGVLGVDLSDIEVGQIDPSLADDLLGDAGALRSIGRLNEARYIYFILRRNNPSEEQYNGAISSISSEIEERMA